MKYSLEELRELAERFGVETFTENIDYVVLLTFLTWVGKQATTTEAALEQVK